MRAASLMAATALLAGCAGPAFRAGQTEAELLTAVGRPTNRYPMAGGATRLEYATGPMGRETYMVDLDAQGRVQKWEQVLNTMTFLQITDGMPRDDLLRLIGRPANRQPEWMGRETWSWRYHNNDCLWFRVTLLPPDWRVQHGGGYMPDPMCDAPNDRVGGIGRSRH